MEINKPVIVMPLVDNNYYVCVFVPLNAGETLNFVSENYNAAENTTELNYDIINPTGAIVDTDMKVIAESPTNPNHDINGADSVTVIVNPKGGGAKKKTTLVYINHN